MEAAVGSSCAKGTFAGMGEIWRPKFCFAAVRLRGGAQPRALSFSRDGRLWFGLGSHLKNTVCVKAAPISMALWLQREAGHQAEHQFLLCKNSVGFESDKVPENFFCFSLPL